MRVLLLLTSGKLPTNGQVKHGMLILLLLLSGCSFSRGIIRTKAVDVVGVREAGTPAKLITGEAKRSFAIPADATVEITRTDATASSPAVESAKFTFPEPSEYQEISSSVDASTGTVDTSVRKHQIDAQERRWLLWCAIGGAIAGIVLRAVLSSWPTLSNGAFGFAALSFAAWKFSEIPAWVVFSVVLVAVSLVLGYKRGEWDKNHDGIPDFLQK